MAFLYSTGATRFGGQVVYLACNGLGSLIRMYVHHARYW